MLLPSPLELEKKNLGVRLYTFRKEMDEDAIGTLEKIAAIGIKKLNLQEIPVLYSTVFNDIAFCLRRNLKISLI